MQDLAFQMYVKGLTTQDIGGIFKDIYGKNLSKTSVSNITKEFVEQRESWLKRPLEEEYYFIYIDAVYLPIRRDNVTKEAFYIVLGLKKDLKREVLGVYNIPQESASGWNEVLSDLQARGLKEILMVIADGLSGLKEVVNNKFPKANLQTCLVHKIRNILLYSRSKDKKDLVTDFKKVFELENPNYSIIEGERKLIEFINKWKKIYPGIKRNFQENNLQNYFAYLEFPHQIHRMIYTTNWIERLNKKIKRTTKIRNAFPTPDSAMNLVCATLMDFEESVYKYPVTAFIQVKSELDELLKKNNKKKHLLDYQKNKKLSRPLERSVP
jgi:transposase-like protein